MQLSRDTIARAAMDILDSYGLADVSMRRVAQSLSVAPGALYWHIANKQALIEAMAELILGPALSGEHTGPREFGLALRSAVFAHRDGADVVSTAVAQPDSELYRELFAHARQTLDGHNVTAATKDAAAAGLIYLVLGAANIQQAEAQLREATGLPDSGATTSDTTVNAIDVLLLGLEHSS